MNKKQEPLAGPRAFKLPRELFLFSTWGSQADSIGSHRCCLDCDDLWDLLVFLRMVNAPLSVSYMNKNHTNLLVIIQEIVHFRHFQ